MKMQITEHSGDEKRPARGFGDGSPLSHGGGGYSNGVGGTRRFVALALVSLCLLLVFLSSLAHAAQVTVTWEANTEPHLAGYRVYYGTASRDYDWSIDVGKATTYTVPNLANGVTYYFASKAYTTSKQESPYSAEAVQKACTYSISPTTAQFGTSAGTGTVSVATQTGCAWTATSSASWLTITAGSSGLGSGTVKYSVSANTSTSGRTASSTFAKNVCTVTQSGIQSYTITASAGTGGAISPSGSVAVSKGGSKTFTITPGTGYKISTVSVDGVSKGALTSYTFSSVMAAHTIRATFVVR